MLLGAKQYYREGQQAAESGDKSRADKLYAQAADLLRLITEKQPASIRPYGIQLGPDIANLYYDLGQATGNDKLRATGRDLMERQVLLYGAYVRYEQNIHIAFPGTAISIETDQSPLRYWGMVEAYQRMGGDYARLKAANPVLQGLDEKTLRAKYDQVRASLENPDLSEGAMQVEMNARRIVGLKDMSPAEYARQPLETRQLDTIFYTLIEDPSQVGATAEDVQNAPSVKRLDLERQKRLYETYRKSHGL